MRTRFGRTQKLIANIRPAFETTTPIPHPSA